jgi:3-hydroxyisobutyrate dehydrogenase
MRRVGFIGLGNMGGPMAARLVAYGFDVVVHDAREDVAQAFVREHGGARAATVAELAAAVEAVITMLPDDGAVEAVMADPGGVLGALRADGIAIDMGTSSPAASVRHAAACRERGLWFVDAPVMGGVPFARDGTLDIMAGGAAEAVERCLLLFGALGRHTYRCGGPGSGHALKAIANFVNAATFVTVLEGLATGRKFGLDTAFMVEALRAMCTGRQHPLEKKVVPQVLTRNFATGMAMGLIAKDVGIAEALARDVGAPAFVATATRELWQEAAKRYGFATDQAEIVRLWEDASGVELS